MFGSGVAMKKDLHAFKAALNSVINSNPGRARVRKNMAIRFDGIEFDTVAELMEYKRSMGLIGPSSSPSVQTRQQRLPAPVIASSQAEEVDQEEEEEEFPLPVEPAVAAATQAVSSERKKPKFGAQVAAPAVAETMGALYRAAPRDDEGYYRMLHRLLGNEQKRYAPEIVQKVKADYAARRVADPAVLPAQIFAFYGIDLEKAAEILTAVRSQFPKLFFEKRAGSRGRLTGTYGINLMGWDEAKAALIKKGIVDPTYKEITSHKTLEDAKKITPEIQAFTLAQFNARKVDPTQPKPNRSYRRY
jgi:hypothetical protein